MTPNDHDKILDAVRRAGEHLQLSMAARSRIERRLSGGAAGATTLRDAERRWPLRAGMLAAAAVLIFAAVWIVPAIDRGTTLSAAEVLGRSQQALATPATGVEVLTYDLTLGGVLQDLLPIGQAGSFTVEEMVDYDHPGRYRLLKLAPGGQVMGAIADDSLTRTRVRYVRLDNGGLMMRFTGVGPATVSAVDVKRTMLKALLAMMQASGDQKLREIDRGGELAYAVDVAGLAGVPGILELHRAAAVVDRTHGRLLEFNAQGTISGRPFAITFNLRSREVRASTALPPDAFTLAPAPDDQVVDLGGDPGAPLWKLMEQCLKK
jgi:hypothetical protein